MKFQDLVQQKYEEVKSFLEILDETDYSEMISDTQYVLEVLEEARDKELTDDDKERIIKILKQYDF